MLALGCDGTPANAAGAAPVSHAVCVLRTVGGSGVSGTVQIREVGGKLHLTGVVRGLEPGRHGFHVHAYGDVRNADDGSTAGGHFAPRGREHGAPAANERHVGDLGNIEANENGVAEIDIHDSVVALDGANSIVGRALVVHAGEDHFTQPSGDAGDRVAFGVIGIASE
jgi:Cu-Zn family superoxide dismutase